MTCFANGTGIYEVGPGGTCELSDSVTGKSALLAAYYILGACILHFGTRQMMARGKRRRAEEEAQPADQQQPVTAVQREVIFGELQPGSGGLRERLESRQLMWLWVGVAILGGNLGDSYLSNLQSNTLTLAESNAIDDARSVITVVQDVFSFFEDGMTVLIGAAVGAGDTSSAGILTTLGFIGGIVSGVTGAALGSVAALTPAIMHAVIPAPTVGPEGCGGGGGTSQAELEHLAMPYWLIAVWSWGFGFCNNVGTVSLAFLCEHGISVILPVYCTVHSRLM
jgi:hypothetical protein